MTGITSARAADLVVAAQARHRTATRAPDVDALLYDAGRPVLVMPHDAALPHLLPPRASSPGTAAARPRAPPSTPCPSSSRPRSTEILVIDPPETWTRAADAAGADIAAALASHGATVSVSVQQSGGSATDDVIRNRLAATGADLLVLGAYSHSWLRELLFGGVTRTVLHSMPVTAFLSR